MIKKILIISPENYPKIKVGGLGKMVTGAAEGLSHLEVDVRVISPNENIYQPLYKKETEENYRKLGLRARYFCQKNNWRPDVLWIHDWGGIWSGEQFVKEAGTPQVIWTIHSPISDNYGYNYNSYGYFEELDDNPIDWGDSFFDFGGLIRKGVNLADKVTTVSKTFAKNLARHQLFESAKTIIGIDNGIDNKEWNAENDELIDFNLGNSWREFKKMNKIILQGNFGLPQIDVPVFTFVSRIVPQKGIKLLLKTLPEFLGKNDIQFIFVGNGNQRSLQYINRLKCLFPLKVGVKLESNFDLPHQVFAGADFLVLPSVSEPYGIVVAEAKKYGVIPIVHLIDGLKDQVTDQINGFGFQSYQQEKLEEKMYSALSSYKSEWQIDKWPNDKNVENWHQVSQKWLALMNE